MREEGDRKSNNEWDETDKSYERESYSKKDREKK